MCCALFFFNDTATTEIYTLSLHDALPICQRRCVRVQPADDDRQAGCAAPAARGRPPGRRRRARERAQGRVAEAGLALDRALRPDRKSTRLNSSHANISYAVFCLKKKK